MNRSYRRFSYLFLCAVPFLDVAVVGVRALRIPGLYQAAGGVLFAAIAIAAWILGAQVLGFAADPKRRLALAGTLLLLPSAINSLLWVGLGAPFQATRSENYMRFCVLLSNSIIVTSGFIALREELYHAGERFYSTVGFAACIPAGTAYFVCMSIIVGSYIATPGSKDSSAAHMLNGVFSVLEFVACVLTYVATAAFAASLGKAGWLGHRASRAYVLVCMVLIALLVTRGLSYPEISDNTAPWYVQPGFIAGIPAVPWIMPCLFGVLLLRQAGEE